MDSSKGDVDSSRGGDGTAANNGGAAATPENEKVIPGVRGGSPEKISLTVPTSDIVGDKQPACAHKTRVNISAKSTASEEGSQDSHPRPCAALPVDDQDDDRNDHQDEDDVDLGDGPDDTLGGEKPEDDPDRTVAFVQHLGNKFSSFVVLNFLFGNQRIRNDEEYNRLMKEACERDADILKDDDLSDRPVHEWDELIRREAENAPETHIPPQFCDEKTRYYVRGLLMGPWVVTRKEEGGRTYWGDTVQRQEYVPINALLTHLHPFVRRSLTFFTLPRRHRGKCGFCFMCFRTRPLLDRFFTVMARAKVVSSCRYLRLNFARLRNLEELQSYFQYGIRQENDNVFWFNESMEKLEIFYKRNQTVWNDSREKNKWRNDHPGHFLPGRLADDRDRGFIDRGLEKGFNDRGLDYDRGFNQPRLDDRDRGFNDRVSGYDRGYIDRGYDRYRNDRGCSGIDVYRSRRDWRSGPRPRDCDPRMRVDSYGRDPRDPYRRDPYPPRVPEPYGPVGYARGPDGYARGPDGYGRSSDGYGRSDGYGPMDSRRVRGDGYSREDVCPPRGSPTESYGRDAYGRDSYGRDGYYPKGYDDRDPPALYDNRNPRSTNTGYADRDHNASARVLSYLEDGGTDRGLQSNVNHAGNHGAGRDIDSNWRREDKIGNLGAEKTSPRNQDPRQATRSSQIAQQPPNLGLQQPQHASQQGSTNPGDHNSNVTDHENAHARYAYDAKYVYGTTPAGERNQHRMTALDDNQSRTSLDRSGRTLLDSSTDRSELQRQNHYNNNSASGRPPLQKSPPSRNAKDLTLPGISAGVRNSSRGNTRGDARADSEEVKRLLSALLEGDGSKQAKLPDELLKILKQAMPDEIHKILKDRPRDEHALHQGAYQQQQGAHHQQGRYDYQPQGVSTPQHDVHPHQNIYLQQNNISNGHYSHSQQNTLDQGNINPYRSEQGLRNQYNGTPPQPGQNPNQSDYARGNHGGGPRGRYQQSPENQQQNRHYSQQQGGSYPQQRAGAYRSANRNY